MASTATRNGRTRQLDKISELLQAKRGIILDVGCGISKHPGSVGMDIQDLHDDDGNSLVDIVWDMNDIPWPLPDEACVTVLASHIIEHVPRRDGHHFIDWMNEVWRILKPDRQFAFVCPYAGSGFYWQDPTHVNPITERTLAYFDPKHEWGFWKFYKPKPWKLQENMYHSEGMLEVVMRKRLEDPETWEVPDPWE